MRENAQTARYVHNDRHKFRVLVFVAEFDGKIVGAIVGYDGANLHELRATTYSIIYKCLGHTPTIPDETEAGEFYLDSIAVFLEYRRLGIGKELIKAIKEQWSIGKIKAELSKAKYVPYKGRTKYYEMVENLLKEY